MGDENKNLNNVIENRRSAKKKTLEEEREDMRREIDGLISQKPLLEHEGDNERVDTNDLRQQRYEETQRQLALQFGQAPGDHPVKGYIVREEDDPIIRQQPSKSSKGGDYRAGVYSGYELSRSHKLSKDPIMELKHIIGYQPSKCRNVKWAKLETESNCVVFTSGGTLIAMNTDDNS
jgi:hypothetical protein